MRLLFLFGCCLLSLLASAQKGTVKGIVRDSTDNHALSLASVAVYSANDTSLITYQLTETSGAFAIKGLPFERLYRLVISFQGYKIFRKEFLLNNKNPVLNFDSILLVEDAKAMEEILISAERPPVMMRNDTLEFNANAFKTLPSALLEDLLKRLPGVDVDLNGNITVNGRAVNRLLVDGKDFFNTDYRIATRNLPANLVEKVQVVDDAEQKARNPQLRQHQLGQVVNIKLKRAVRQGWFGKVYGGAGTSQRHEAGGIVNIFRDTVQVSLLGFSNNVNKAGFDMNDMQNIGGTARGGNQSINEFSTSGIQHSLGGGINFNNELAKNVSVNLNYFYKQRNSLDESKEFTQQFLSDTVLYASSTGRYEHGQKEHNIGGRIRWKLDSFSTIEFNPNVSIGTEHSLSTTLGSTTDNFKGLVNQRDDRSFSMSKPFRYHHTVSYYSNRGHKKNFGLNVNQSTSVYNGNGDEFQNGIYTFFTNNIGRDSLLNLLRARKQHSISHSVSLNVSKTFADWFQVSLRHQSKYEENADALNFYSKVSGNDLKREQRFESEF